MALAKRCDLCMRFYMPYGSKETTSTNAITLESMNETNDCSEIISSYDLCPCCSNSICAHLSKLMVIVEGNKK